MQAVPVTDRYGWFCDGLLPRRNSNKLTLGLE